MLFIQVRERAGKANCLDHVPFSLTLCIVIRQLVAPVVVRSVNFIISHSAIASKCKFTSY